MTDSDIRFLWRYAWGGIGFCFGVVGVVLHMLSTGIVPSDTYVALVLFGAFGCGAAFPLMGLDDAQL